MADISNTSYSNPESGSGNIVTTKEDTLQNQLPNMTSQANGVSQVSNTIPPATGSSDALSSLNPSQLTANAQDKIPPLMSIRTDVTPPPTQLPTNPPTVTDSTFVSQGETQVSQSFTATERDTRVASLSVSPNVPAVTTTSTVSLGKPKVSQGKVMGDGTSQLQVSSYSMGETDSDDGGVQKKVPILRLKKKPIGQDDADATFERQEISKNDSYCWVCHDGGDVLCCDKCPRVFHIQCSGLPKAPEGEEEWFCPVCKNIARKTKRSRPSSLKELLLLAVGRMMFPGTEIFQSPVPADIMIHYREYVFHPLDMGTIRKKVLGGEYQSTREFTHDTEWILHNCIIYNGAKHALTKIAKGIIKVCKEDMREIELCPGCYKLTVKQPKDWFCVPCNPPHPVVLAKVRGYPLWPAKLISETSDKCDVRFFGQHDRSLVPKSSISELNGLPPKPSTKTQHWNIAMFELKKYGENIEEMRAQMSGGKLPGKSIRFPKRDPKTPTTDHNNHQRELGNSMSNHLASSPAVVEVSPTGVHGNSSVTSDGGPPILSEPSSPDSPPDLQIDLEESTQRGGGKHYQSPNKGLGTLSAIERNSQVSGSLDFSIDTGPQTVTNSALSSPTSSLSKIKRGIKGRKAGDTLSQLVSRMAERKGMGVVTPSGSAPVVVTSSGVATQLESMETESGGREDTEDPVGSATAVVQVNSFSSVYLDRNKTAIYEVDPNQKRKRKKPNNEGTPPLAKKAARTKTSPNKTTSLNADSVNNDSPQIHVASSELVKLSHSSTGDRVPSSVSPQPPQGMTVSNGQTHATQASLPVTGIISGPKSNVTPVKSGRGSNPASKKKNRTKGTKGAKSSLAGKTASPSVAQSPSIISKEQNSPIVSSALGQTGSTYSSSAGGEGVDVRGEEAAPGVGSITMETDDFKEGNGLLADTIRKVNRSFHARLNQMSGGSEDMGYQYFMEKLMSSVKTVLIEMLSTFEAKSRLSAKQLKEQLHTCWPVPNSRVALDQLRKELRDEMKQSLEVVRASAALELEQVVNEVRRQVEKEKEIAVIETKKKKWCSYCMKEAQYNCCWNANYCNEVCQQQHWPEHMKDCTQIQQQVPKTPVPAPSDVPLSTPVSKAPTSQLVTSGLSMGTQSGSSVALPGQEPQQQQHPGQQGSYMFVNSSAAAMAAAAAAHAQAQRQQSQMSGMVSGSAGLPQQTMHNAQAGISPSGPGGVPGGPHSQKQRLAQDPSAHSHSSASLVNVEGMAQHHSMDHNTPPENTASRMDHLPNDNILITTAAASPPNHIRSLFLSQNQQQTQQQQRMSTKSPGMSQILVGGHQGPGTPGNPMHHGLASTPIGMAENQSIGSASHPGQPQQASDHSHSSGSGVLLHAQSPMSPAIPHSETQPSVHNYSWPYSQQVIIGNENYHHALPLLPATMQVNTSSSQNQPFFKATY